VVCLAPKLDAEASKIFSESFQLLAE
jgi:hypothetical protein